jgi:hypothetical protein
MGSKRRYLGTSHLFNVKHNNDFKNGLDIHVDDDGVQAAISSLLEPNRKVVVSASGKDSRIIRELLLTLEREGMRSRKMAGEFAVPKKKRSRQLQQPAVCSECGGYGGNSDEEGNWKDCRLCR